jgi:prephenate dehydrogenase
VAVVTTLIEQLGMQPVLMSPDDHDELVAQISHLPYLVAIAAVAASGDRAIGISGPTFGSFLRVARGPVQLWAQISRGNRAALKRALERFRQELDHLERALDGEESLETLLTRSRQRASADRAER